MTLVGVVVAGEVAGLTVAVAIPGELLTRTD